MRRAGSGRCTTCSSATTTPSVQTISTVTRKNSASTSTVSTRIYAPAASRFASTTTRSTPVLRGHGYPHLLSRRRGRHPAAPQRPLRRRHPDRRAAVATPSLTPPRRFREKLSVLHKPRRSGGLAPYEHECSPADRPRATRLPAPATNLPDRLRDAVRRHSPVNAAGDRLSSNLYLLPARDARAGARVLRHDGRARSRADRHRCLGRRRRDRTAARRAGPDDSRGCRADSPRAVPRPARRRRRARRRLPPRTRAPVSGGTRRCPGQHGISRSHRPRTGTSIRLASRSAATVPAPTSALSSDPRVSPLL